MTAKDLHFFKPSSWQDAKMIDFLEPKEKHIHQIHIGDVKNVGRHIMLCRGETCPICQIKEKKTIRIRVSLFFQDIIKAVKRLFR